MKKSEETKQKILETTIETIAEKGYAPTTTKEIADRAGVSEGTIFKYYGSKKDLLREIVESTIREFRDYSVNEAFPEVFAEVPEQSPEELLYRMMKERTEFFQEHESAMQVIFQETMIDESIRETFREEVWEEMTKFTDRIFDKAKELGKFKDYENRILRRTIFGPFFFWVIYEDMLEVEGREEEIAPEEVKKTLDLMLTGMLKEQEKK